MVFSAYTTYECEYLCTLIWVDFYLSFVIFLRIETSISRFQVLNPLPPPKMLDINRF